MLGHYLPPAINSRHMRRGSTYTEIAGQLALYVEISLKSQVQAALYDQTHLAVDERDADSLKARLVQKDEMAIAGRRLECHPANCLTGV